MSSCALLVVLASGAAARTARAAGNPYSFYGSIAECASAERNSCDACLAGGSCPAITDLGDGDAECTQLAAGDGRGYSLICVNLALAIDAVASCAARRAPSCPRDTRASESISSLDANAGFLDDPGCAAPLDACLARLYGAPRGGSPSPGGSSPPPRDTTVSCDDSCSGDPNCDASPGCEVYASDDGCSDSGESSSCEDSSGGDAGGTDSCSGDSEDSCGSQDNSGCDDSDCGGGGDSDCGSSSSGGGDCDSGGGGGDCGGGGGGGDCGGGGGGGDCNVGGKRGRAGASLPIAVAWALLPLPFAIIVRRRAERRRARAAWDEENARAGREVAP